MFHFHQKEDDYIKEGMYDFFMFLFHVINQLFVGGGEVNDTCLL